MELHEFRQGCAVFSKDGKSPSLSVVFVEEASRLAWVKWYDQSSAKTLHTVLSLDNLTHEPSAPVVEQSAPVVEAPVAPIQVPVEQPTPVEQPPAADAGADSGVPAEGRASVTEVPAQEELGDK